MRTRHKRARFVATASAMVLGTSAIIIGVASPSSAAVSSTSPALDTALNDVRACMSRENSILNVYYLFDSSGSLVQGSGASDKNGLRFEALRQSIFPLAELAGSGNEVFVAGGSFDDNAQALLDWTPITQESPEAQAREIVASMTTPAGGNTNWVAGLDLAAKELSRRSESTKGKRDCQVLVWVTDGGIEIPTDDSSPESEQVQADARGIKELCGVDPTTPSTALPEGTMYSLRNSGVVVLGLLLRTNQTAADPDQASRLSYFKPIVEGAGVVDGTHFGETKYDYLCGETVPGAQGAQIVAKKAEELARAFSLLARCILDSCTLPAPGSYSRDADGNWTIPVPEGISSLQIFSADKKWSIVNPDGTDPCTASDKCQKVGGGGNVPVLGQAGNWKLKSSDDSTSWSYISGLSVAMANNALLQGKSPSFEFTALQDGQPVEAARFAGGLVLEATAQTPGNADPVPLPMKYADGRWTLSDPASVALTQSGVITTRLKAVAKGQPSATPPISNLQLTEVVERHDFTVSLPAEFPELVSPKLPDEFAAFTTLSGTGGVATTTLKFQGSATSDGEVCLSDPSITSDSGSTDRADSWEWTEESCVPVPKGQIVETTVEARNSQQFDGLVRGSIPLLLKSDAVPDTFTVDVPFEMKTEVVKSGLAYLIVLVILILLGLAAPYILLVWLARRQATFNQALDGARWGAIPATLNADGLVKFGDLNPEEFKSIFFDGTGRQRVLSTNSETHRIVPPRWWPFRAPVAKLEAAEGMLAVSNQGSISAVATNVASSSLALADVFYFVARKPEVETGLPLALEVDSWNEPAYASLPDGFTNGDSGKTVAGHVVVIASNGIDLAGAIERAKANARTWASWPRAYASIIGQPAAEEQRADSQPKSKGPKAPKNRKQNDDVQPPNLGTGGVDW